jgi:hypothetical protein
MDIFVSDCSVHMPNSTKNWGRRAVRVDIGYILPSACEELWLRSGKNDVVGEKHVVEYWVVGKEGCWV